MQHVEQLPACWEISPSNQQIIPNDLRIHTRDMAGANTTKTCFHTSMNNPMNWALRYFIIVKVEF